MRRELPRYDIPKKAPDPLWLVQLFVNTIDREHGRDSLGTPSRMRDWFVEHRLLTQSARIRLSDVNRADQLRAALRALLGSIEQLDDPTGVFERNACAAKLTLRLEDGKAILAPTAPGVAGALGKLLAIVSAAMADGSWQRLKACRNCGWVFYDYSRNRSAAWCSMRVCGNRAKTRSYYRRRHPSRP